MDTSFAVFTPQEECGSRSNQFVGIADVPNMFLGALMDGMVPGRQCYPPWARHSRGLGGWWATWNQTSRSAIDRASYFPREGDRYG